MSLIQSHNQTVLSSLREGDLIQFSRGLYSHWGVYKGGGEVVHLAGVDGESGASVSSGSFFTISGVRFNKAKVSVDNFWTVAADSMANKNNTKDGEWSHFSREEIVERATRFLGYVQYSVITANCEHFAKWCRYGIWQSDQAETVTTVAFAGLGSLLIGTVLALALSSGRKQKR